MSNHQLEATALAGANSAGATPQRAQAANEQALRRSALIERITLLSLCTPALLLIGVFLVIPMAWLFWLSFVGADGAFSFENYLRMAQSKSYLQIFKLTFQLSAMATLICIAIGYPLAYALSQFPTRIANLCMITVLVPFWTSLLVRTYAWLVLLQRQGIINQWGIDLGLWNEPLALVHNFTGTLIGMVHIMLPFLVLPVYAAMKAIDKDYMKAASNLGASPTQVFWKVFFPLTLPGLFAGTLIIFILCLGFYVTPAVLGGGKVIMVSMRIASNIELFVNWGAASALGVVLFLLTALTLYLASRVVKLDYVFGKGGHGQ